MSEQGWDLFGAFERASAVKERYQDELMKKANVIGVGVGLKETGGALTEEVVLVVFVTEKKPVSQLAPEDLLPAELEGVPVDVQAIGEVGAH